MAMFGIILIIIIILLIIVGIERAKIENDNKEAICNKFVEFVSDKHDVKIEIGGILSNKIECQCKDMYENNCLLQENNIYQRKDQWLLMAGKIYSKLPSERYEIIYGFGTMATIQETHEYKLQNQVFSLKTSEEKSLQEYLKEIAPQHKENNYMEYIECYANKMRQELIEEIEQNVRKTVYSSDMQAQAKKYFNEENVIKIQLLDMKNGEGIFIPATTWRCRWRIEPSNLLLQTVSVLKKICEQDNLGIDVQMEIKLINTFSSNIIPRIKYYPLNEIEVLGEWGEERIEAKALVTATIHY